MRTAGIDLATQPERTAVCTIDWTSDSATVRLVHDRSDTALIEVCRTADRTGIDCPFGWPQPFVTALQAHADRRPWPGRHEEQTSFRRHLALRETDREVHRLTRCTPLSVAADRIGLTAMRCASLLDGLGDVDRTGVDGPVSEVYPAATLRTWNMRSTGVRVVVRVVAHVAGLRPTSQAVRDVRGLCNSCAVRRFGARRGLYPAPNVGHLLIVRVRHLREPGTSRQASRRPRSTIVDRRSGMFGPGRGW